MAKQEPDGSWFAEAGRYANRKVSSSDHFQGLAMLAMAEAIHRLAAAVERSQTP